MMAEPTLSERTEQDDVAMRTQTTMTTLRDSHPQGSVDGTGSLWRINEAGWLTTRDHCL
jgi:hypothetical protein